MDTPESGEDHLRARMRHLTMNLYLNRTCNCQWGTEADKIALNAADIPENGFLNNNDNEFLTTVHPNARVYLMVRALCEYAGPSAVPTEQTFPSYDIVLTSPHRSVAD